VPKILSELQLRELSSLSTPGVNLVSVAPKVDGKVYRKDDAGSESELGGAGGHVVSFARTTNLDVSELIAVRVLEGTFVAQATSYVFDIAIDAYMVGPAWCVFYLYAGHATAGGPGAALYDASLAAVNGGTSYEVGVIGYENNSGISTPILVSGLTIGQTVTFQVMPGIIGGSAPFKCFDAPAAMAITPNQRKMFVCKWGSASIQPWRLNPIGANEVFDFGWNPQPGMSIPAGVPIAVFGAGTGQLAVGNVSGLATNVFSNTVTTFDVADEVKLRDTAPPTGAVSYVTLNVAETTAYVSTVPSASVGGGRFFPITVSTGAAGTAVAPGAATDDMKGLTLTADETKLYVCNYTQNRVEVVTLPSTVGSPIATVGKPVNIKRPPGLAVTGVAATDVLTTARPHTFLVNEKVVLSGLAGGAGLTNGTNYFVIADGLGASTLKLSATQGGAAVNFTTNITAGVLQRNKLWVLTEAGGTGGVAMMKSIDLSNDTVSATYNCDFPTGKEFGMMSHGQACFIGCAVGKFQQLNLETEFAGGRPAGHSAQMSYLDDNGVAQLYTGDILGVVCDALDSIYFSLFSVDQLFVTPGGRLRISLNDGIMANYARAVVRSV
jgi:hypothetical protein